MSSALSERRLLFTYVMLQYIYLTRDVKKDESFVHDFVFLLERGIVSVRVGLFHDSLRFSQRSTDSLIMNKIILQFFGSMLWNH